MRVVVALDGSKCSENAAGAVAPWVRGAGAAVVLVTVRDPASIHETNAPAGYVHALTPKGTTTGPLLAIDEPVPVPVEDRTQALERARVDSEEYLKEVAERHFKGVDADVYVEWSEHTAEAIVRCAEANDADLIAMGTHGRSGLRHALVGSVTEAVVRRSPVPVFLAREGMPPARAGERVASTVLPSVHDLPEQGAAP